MRFPNVALGLPFEPGAHGSSAPPVAGDILLENGVDMIELEDGSGVILLEG